MKELLSLAVIVAFILVSCVNDTSLSVRKSDLKQSPLFMLTEENPDWRYENLRQFNKHST
ncbi:MAG: hypothetical protein Q7T20_14690 [Saprospiraceae bacterium]|nr:hypothetical protein [Saprospiraceae bacterium]